MRTRKNWALHANTTQKSTRDLTTGPEKVVDGNTINLIPGGSCASTKPNHDVYFFLYLRRFIYIEDVVIITNADCCGMLFKLVSFVQRTGGVLSMKEMFYLTTHSIYIFTVLWCQTYGTVPVREETAAATWAILYAPSHRQDSTCHGLCCTSRETHWNEK